MARVVFWREHGCEAVAGAMAHFAQEKRFFVAAPLVA
jgi:hypothetical protein